MDEEKETAYEVEILVGIHTYFKNISHLDFSYSQGRHFTFKYVGLVGTLPTYLLITNKSETKHLCVVYLEIHPHDENKFLPVRAQYRFTLSHTLG